MASVAVGAGELQPAAAATVRQEMQNWVSFPNFLLPDHWVCWQSNERQLHKLETVVNHLIRMGLRHPSERTQATLAAIVSHVGPNAMDPFAAPDVPRQTALLSTVKAVCKTQLLRLRNVGLPMPGGYIIELPASVQDLPLALRNEMFPGGGVPPPMDLNPIWQVAQAWAVRSTHRSRTMGQSNLMGAASASDAASIAAQAALSTVLALAPHVAGARGSSSDAVPGLQIFGGVNRATSAAASGSRTEFGALLDRASAGNADSATPTVTPALALEDRPHAAVEPVVPGIAQPTVAQPPPTAVQSTEALETEAADAEPDLEMNLAALADAHYNCPLPSVVGSCKDWGKDAQTGCSCNKDAQASGRTAVGSRSEAEAASCRCEGGGVWQDCCCQEATSNRRFDHQVGDQVASQASSTRGLQQVSVSVRLYAKLLAQGWDYIFERLNATTAALTIGSWMPTHRSADVIFVGWFCLPEKSVLRGWVCGLGLNYT